MNIKAIAQEILDNLYSDILVLRVFKNGDTEILPSNSVQFSKETKAIFSLSKSYWSTLTDEMSDEQKLEDIITDIQDML